MYCPTCGGKNDDGSAYCVTCGATLPAVADTKLSAPDEQRNQRETTSNRRSNPKQRHGCLTAYLIIIIVITALGLVLVPLAPVMTDLIQSEYTEYSITFTWATWVALAASAVQIAFAVAIYKWKRWGVYGFVGATVVELILTSIDTEGANNFSGIPSITPEFAAIVSIIITAIVGILTIALLVVALKMGKPSGWDQLE